MSIADINAIVFILLIWSDKNNEFIEKFVANLKKHTGKTTNVKTRVVKGR